MNLLWMCNIELPIISEAMGNSVAISGGWMDILSRKTIGERHNLQVIYPKTDVDTVQKIELEGVTIYQLPHSVRNNSNYDQSYEMIFRKILNENSFDCIHLWGCEFPRTLAMLKICKEMDLLDNTILEIQGIKHFIAKNYFASLPRKVIRSKRIRDIYYNKGIKKAKRLYEQAGKHEIKAIETAKNIMGRTDWDLAAVKSINPEVNYYKCNRILRKAFYSQKWELENCDKHSIFVSSYSTPVKGLHYILEAMPIILQKYPKSHLYVVGPFGYPTRPSFIQKLKLGGYGKHIYGLISENKLEDNVTFLGRLDEKQMMDRYLKSHVYISASAMENSPNTVAEAMTLGLPAICSLVGGVSSMLSHNIEGFLYQYDAPYMMAHYVNKIFCDDQLALELSKNARERAKVTHDIETNYNRLISTYEILSSNKGKM